MENVRKLPSFITDQNLKLILFGGKGGVGKTTAAAAASLLLSRLYAHKKLLVISTDPAHSLSDSFNYPLSREIKAIYGRSDLFGLELDAAEAMDDFLNAYGAGLKKLLSRGTYLNDNEISSFLKLSFPGLDEVMALAKIVDLLKEAEFNPIIVDTAPTGHTLNLLSLPTLMESWVNLLDAMMEKHRFMSRAFSEKYIGDEADQFLTALGEKVSSFKALLRGGECQFVPVLLPEAMSVRETERLIGALETNRVPVGDVIVNRFVCCVGCLLCHSISASQEIQIDRIRETFRGKNILLVPCFLQEVRGERMLERYGQAIVSPPEKALHFTPSHVSQEPPPPFSVGSPPLKFYLFGGKGGVGKTSIAASFALHLAEKFQDRPVLLFSTDPAHSLSDRFNRSIGNEVKKLNGYGRLYAVEIDSQQAFSRLKKEYAEEVHELLQGLAGAAGAEVPFDREVMENLLDLAPPGLDEIMALLEITRCMEEGAYHHFVLDNAPTGHLLRFLQLPQLMTEWLKAIFEVFLRYRTIIRLPKTSGLLVDMSKKIKEIRRLFADAAKSEFIPVAIPTVMSLNETERLLNALRALAIPYHRLILNMVYPDSPGCPYCSLLRRQHKSVAAAYSKRFPGLEVITVPYLMHGIRDERDLKRLLSPQ